MSQLELKMHYVCVFALMYWYREASVSNDHAYEQKEQFLLAPIEILM